MAELGDASDEDKLLVGIASLDDLVKLLHNAAHIPKNVRLVHMVQQWCVVFVENDYGFRSGLPMGALNQSRKAHSGCSFFLDTAVYFFVSAQLKLQGTDDSCCVRLVFA